MYLSAFPDTAQGVDLSYAVTLTGQQRLQATASTVVAQLTGTPNTLIPAGFQAAVVGSGAIFLTTADVTLDPIYGTASTTMIAQQLGPIAAPLGTLTVINTPVPGLSSVNNATDASLGRNDETDSQLRSRRAQQLVTAVGGTQTAVQGIAQGSRRVVRRSHRELGRHHGCKWRATALAAHLCARRHGRRRGPGHLDGQAG